MTIEEALRRATTADELEANWTDLLAQAEFFYGPEGPKVRHALALKLYAERRVRAGLLEKPGGERVTKH